MALTTFQALRILISAIASFVCALIITPFVMNLITKLELHKQIRTSASAPIFAALHKNKQGTPTAGGIIIWGTVLILAILFSFNPIVDFIDRPQTYLPLASLFIAAAIGFIDDLLGILRRGPNGGGLSMRYKLVIYFFIALVGAWWFY